MSQALAPDTVIYFVIFACYLLAIQGVVLSFTRYASQRNLIRSRLQTGIDTARHARAAAGGRRTRIPLRRDLTNSVVRAGLSPTRCVELGHRAISTENRQDDELLVGVII